PLRLEVRTRFAGGTHDVSARRSSSLGAPGSARHLRGEAAGARRACSGAQGSVPLERVPDGDRRARQLLLHGSGGELERNAGARQRATADPTSDRREGWTALAPGGGGASFVRGPDGSRRARRTTV